MKTMSAASLIPYVNKLFQVWRTGKYSKLIVAQALVLAATGLYLYKTLVPPAKLRQYPSVNYFKLAYYFVTKKDPSQRASELIIPLLRKNNAKAYVAKFPGQWNIIIVDPVAAKALLMKTEYFPKTFSLFKILGDSHPFVKFFGRENVVFSNGDVWKSQRKVMNPAFRRAVPVQLFGKLMQKVFGRVDAQQGKPVVLIDLFERMTLDALSLGLFAVDFQALSDEESEWMRTYTSIRLSFRDTTAFVLPRLESFLRHILPSRKQVSRDVDHLNAKLMDMACKRREEIRARRLQSGDATDKKTDAEKDLLTMIMEGEMDGVGGLSTAEQLRSNLAIFFLAGHDTTANALCFALYNLAVHPHIQEKARQEALRVLGDEPIDICPTAEQCKQLKYIDMFIKENLRLYGPVGQIGVREATQDMLLGDVFVPKGATVTIDLNAIHRHPDFWQDPDQFDPERFADDGESKSHEGLAWIPFSNGGRQCIGMNFSLAEQRVALSMILRKYNITLPANSLHRSGLQIGSATSSAPYTLTVSFENRY